MSEVPEKNKDLTLPLSPEQRLLLSAQLDGIPSDPSTLLRVFFIDIDGPLDASRLHKAMTQVFESHGIFRSAFRHVAGYRGIRWQPLEKTPVFTWEQVDLSHHSEPEKSPAFLSWEQSLKEAPLAIDLGHVLRAGLVKSSAKKSILILVVSVLVADAGSLLTLFEQIATAYADESADDLAEVFQYSQFVEWRQDVATGDDAQAGRKYWAQYLTDADALMPLRLSQQSGNAGRASAQRVSSTYMLNAIQVKRVYAVAELLGARAEVFIQAAWWLQLGRLNDFSGFIGGWQHDCRRDYEVMQGAVGLFEKILPIVVDVTSDESFEHWLARLDSVAAAHLDAQEILDIEAAAVTKLCVAGFSSIDATRAQRFNSAWQVREIPGPMTDFELALQIEWGTDNAAIALYADGSRYTVTALQQLLTQFTVLLNHVLDQPSSDVATLCRVGAEQHQALLAMNADLHDFGSLTLAEHIERWAKLTADAPAIEAGERCLNFQQLFDRVNRMAHWLRGYGVAPGDLVALQLPRSLDLPVVMLAAWRLGAAYLPLEPEWPPARIQAVLADAKPTLLIHADSLQIELNPIVNAFPYKEVVLVSTDFDAPDQVAFDEPLPPVWSLEHLAYVLYTSGSTGQPKGVPITHGQLLNYVAAASAAMNLGSSRRWAVTTSVAADLGNTALFGALFNGSCLVVAGKEDMQDADAFARFMAEKRIDGLKMVPSHLEALLECAVPCLPAKLVLGGEATSRSLVEHIYQLVPACSLYNHYGPTESTVGVMVHAFDSNAQIPEVLPLSRVLANNRIHVLDKALRLVPHGAIGEVYIGGAQLCHGYLNDDSSPAFIADPFLPSQRLYRTGDIARVLLDGGIQWIGRADHQLKIRGFRVEPAEVETALLAQPGVRQAVIMPWSGTTAHQALAAFLVLSPPGSEEMRLQLRNCLTEVLPEHMRPTRYEFLSEFPRLANGKVDRIKLLSLLDGEVNQTALSLPRDAVERVIVDCMATLVGRKTIGIDQDFFELGGHSLLVIKLVARIRKLLKVEIAPALIFDQPTPAELAAALRRQELDNSNMEQYADMYQQHIGLDRPTSESSDVQQALPN